MDNLQMREMVLDIFDDDVSATLCDCGTISTRVTCNFFRVLENIYLGKCSQPPSDWPFLYWQHM